MLTETMLLKPAGLTPDDRSARAMKRRAGRAFTLIELPVVRKRKAIGFTLIELLIVVAILSLLMALLLPSLGRARKIARKSVCLGNIHAIGIASVMYQSCYNGFVPRGNNLLWYRAFLPFLPENDGKETDFRRITIYRCPSYPDKRQTVCYVDSSWAFESKNDMVGYEFNRPSSVDRMDRPQDTIYLADNENGWWRPIITGRYDPEIDRNDVWHPNHMPWSDEEHITYGRRVARDRHLGGSNVMYFDGHGKFIPTEEMTIDMWRFIYRRAWR